MKIPNHILFHEYICNLSESGGCTFEIILTFNMNENNGIVQTKIDEYFEIVKHYCLEECRTEWQVWRKLSNIFTI